MTGNQSSSARVRRDAAARAMQGWHAQRMVANGTSGDQILKVKKVAFYWHSLYTFSIIHLKMLSFLQDKDSIPLSSHGKNLKDFGMLHKFSPANAFMQFFLIYSYWLV
jgi:hypothetical protein